MLGRARYRPRDPRDDGLLLDKRVAHQQQRAREYRQLARELAPETDIGWLAALQPALYDLSDCRHGCSGWPCNSERCTFTCHEGLPVKT
jgi:hypothetical protein